MHKYVIDYTHGQACFWTNEGTQEKAVPEFVSFASYLFGIRKSIGAITVLEHHMYAQLPLPFRGFDATHCLTFQGDEYLFDGNWESKEAGAWRLHENGDWCSCLERGQPSLSCEVHKYDAENKIQYARYAE